MHELSLCRSLLDIINEHVVGNYFKCIKKVTLEVGQLSAVDESALRFGFEIVTKGTLAEGAILDIITIEGQAICNACHQYVKLEHYYDACLNCGQFSLTVTQGEELRIQSMEVA
ncbi:MAG: hydrogenase maturation nickel metallochaperone HypA [Legionellales bacterium RIFCSPHIGHO2_12_FULL_42_9]|nr:MAG: hydrogenase maturation nickel metallochaperone HypA [Legionellales bacterium RIFCSPHIGHO2_12_FULL_42_9]